MLRYRLISAFAFVSAALLFVYLDANFPLGDCVGTWMVPFGFLLVFGSAIECALMARKSSFGSVTWPSLLGCGGVMLAACVPVYWPAFGEPYPADCLLGPLGWPLAAAAIALVGGFVWYMPHFETGQGFLIRASLAGWVAVYFGICFSFSVALRLNGTSGWGLFLLVGVIVITKCADAGAYFTGRALGRTKLCPAVSPGKTVEGLLGGIVVATLAGWVYFCIAAPRVFPVDQIQVGWPGAVALGVGLTVAGVLGDLLESIFKREMDCKDSGRLLPGLGGLWDVTDSLLPACVIAYLVVMAELISGPVR